MRFLPIIFCASILSTPALAHTPPGEYGSFMAGFSHPFFGLDHVLAMLTVGLWASMLGNKGVLAVPAAFVGTMFVGFALALLNLQLPLVEPMILTSTVIFGLMVALSFKLQWTVCAGIVGMFALFHGHAHGSELGEAGAITFGMGFVLATIILHAIGIVSGITANKISTSINLKNNILSRGLGAATAVVGLMISFV